MSSCSRKKSGCHEKNSRCSSCVSCADCTCDQDCQCTETLCRCEASSVLNSLQRTTDTMEATFTITGMTCQSCVRTVSSILEQDESTVDLSTGKATAQVTSRAQALQFMEELADVGFDATLERLGDDDEEKKATVNHSVPGSPPRLANSSIEDTPRSPLFEGTEAWIDPLATIRFDPLAPSVSSPLAPPSSVAVEKVEMVVGGMTCTVCSNAITSALHRLNGVTSAQVNLATNLATIVYYPRQTSPSSIQEAIENIGYEVLEIISEEENRLQEISERQREEVARKKWAFLYSLAGTVPIFFMTMILPHLLSKQNNLYQWLSASISIFGFEVDRESFLLWILATPVQFGSGWTFYKSALKQVHSGMLGMDVLVALGTTASYGYAVEETLSKMGGHFFETSAVLISFVLLGKWMNSLAVRRTSEALFKLVKLQSRRAIRVTPQQENVKNWNPTKDSYNEETVDIVKIVPGDTVKVLRGASIPADGVVSHGEMTVDESMITGESIPVLKVPGSIVLGGTVCVESQHAACFVCVTGVGSSTALSQIVQLVQEAQTRQVPIQSLADTISAVFVPTVCTLSLLTYMVWYALCNTGIVPEEWFVEEGAGTFSLMFGIACLVISCPCALGLATPTAIMVGTGVGASNGILMKGGEALEKASTINSVVFDKTGTLTKGKPCVTDFIMLPDVDVESDQNYLLWLLASLERNSEHPLAAAVVSYAESSIGIKYLESYPLAHPSSFRALTGRGASGTIEDDEVAVGNRRFATLMDIVIPPRVEDCMQKLEHDGKTAILAAVNGSVCVVMGIADELKPDAAPSIKYLVDEMKMDVWMVTGDNARTARAISRKLGLAPNRVISEALPVAKVRQVKKLQREGKVVAMIGDGINDSPALAQADVGMSLGTGAEIAAEASDMVLVRGNVSDVCTALDLSRTIFRKIQWNFVWSLLYNVLGIPIAAGVFYPLVHTRLPPTLAGLAMALSSVSVVGNSLALRLYRPPMTDAGSLSVNHHSHLGRHGQSPNTSDNDLTQSLLERDDQIRGAVSISHDGTEAVDNRTRRMEEGLSL